MSGIHKTAVALSGLPEEVSATLLQKLEPEIASKVRIEMTRLKGTSKENLGKAVAEFLDAINTTDKPQPQATKPKQAKQESVTYSPPPYNRIASTFDREVSDSGTFTPVPQTMESFSQGIDVLTLETNRSMVSQEPVPEKPQLPRPANEPFGFLNALEAEQVRELLLFETPRIVAVLLTQLSPELAGKILEQLTPQVQKDVVSILFGLEEIDAEILREIEAVLKERTESIFGITKKNIGHAAARRILQAIDPAVRRQILGEKPVEKPKETPKHAVAFEDLQNLPDRGLREVFDSVDAKTALISLVGAPQELIDRVLGKQTPEQEKRVLRQYQSFAPINQIDIDAARQRILTGFR